MVARERRYPICTYLVGDIAVGGNTVCAHNHCIDRTRRHQHRSHVVTDERHGNARTDKDAERDYLVVLGAAVYGDRPSLTLVRRLEGARDYLNACPDAVAIVSGGMGPGETVTEAQAMHDWLIEHGIPEERVLMEPEATSTLVNLSKSYDIIRSRGDEPDGKVAIVSSAYHLYRAKLISRSLGVEAAGVAAPWGYFFVMLNYFIREAFGVTKLWLLGP